MWALLRGSRGPPRSPLNATRQTPVGDLGHLSVALFVVLAVSGVDALPLLTVNPRRLFRGQPPALVQQAVSPFRRWIPALCKNF